MYISKVYRYFIRPYFIYIDSKCMKFAGWFLINYLDLLIYVAELPIFNDLVTR